MKAQPEQVLVTEGRYAQSATRTLEPILDIPRNAHVVAAESVTCLVISPEAPTAFLGRGEDARITGSTNGADQEQVMAEATCLDVGPYLQHKLEAIAAHRSQFPIDPHLLPYTILHELMGHEYFVRVSPGVAVEPEFPAFVAMEC